jgi:hypothetical protein
MPNSMIPLLAERLDISEGRARSLLKTMVEELRRRATSDGVQLSGLGTFREEDGRLTFRPSPALRRRVNRPYEGLSAESLSPPTAPADDSPASDDAETPPFLTRKSSDEAEDAREAGAPDASSPSQADGEEAPGQDRSPTRPDAEERTPDSFTVISLVLAVLFLAGVGWFMLNRTALWGPSQDTTPPTATETPSDQAPGTPSGDAGRDSQTGASAPAEETSSGDPEDTLDVSEDTPDVQDWTVVVASSLSRSAARETADAYASQFDSVAVVPGTVDNTTWHRVTIGRYTSEAAAERVLADRADALPPDAWTHQLE